MVVANLIFSPAALDIVCSPHLVASPLAALAKQASADWLAGLSAEQLGASPVVLEILNGGHYYYVAEALAELSGRPVRVARLRAKRYLADGGEWGVRVWERSGASLAGATSLLIGDTIATGTTLAGVLKEVLKELREEGSSGTLPPFHIFSIAGAAQAEPVLSLSAAQLTLTYANAAFSLHPNGTDLRFSGPGSRWHPRAAAQLPARLEGLEPRCAVYDWGDRFTAPEKHLEELGEWVRSLGEGAPAWLRHQLAVAVAGQPWSSWDPPVSDLVFESLPGFTGGFGVACTSAMPPSRLAQLCTADKAALLAALDTHAMLVLRPSSALSAEQLHRFGEALMGAGGLVDFGGTSMDAIAQGGGGAACHAPGVPTVRALGNVKDAEGKAASLLCRIGYEWHNDGMGPGVLSILHCLSTVDAGGETLFTSTSGMYDRLSEPQRAFADAAVAVHSNRFTGGGPAAVDGECGVRMDATGTRRVAAATSRRPDWELNEARHALVQVHPHSGRRCLIPTGKNLDHFDSPAVMGPEESGVLMSELMCAHLQPQSLASVGEDGLPAGKTHFSPQTVLEFSWTQNDIVVWDNQALLHSTTPVCLYGSGTRAFYHVIGTDVGRGASKPQGGDYGGPAAAAPAGGETTFFL